MMLLLNKNVLLFGRDACISVRREVSWCLQSTFQWTGKEVCAHVCVCVWRERNGEKVTAGMTRLVC